MKKWIVIGLAVAIIACSVMWFDHWKSEQHAANTTYRTAAVEKGDVVQRISVNGTLNPLHVVNVGTQVSGTIYKMYVDYNQKVKKGQVLAEIEPSLLVSQLDQSKAMLAAAEAKLSLSEKSYRRIKALLEKDYVARQDLDAAEQDLENSRAQVLQARAQVKRDQINVDYAVIHSPVSGVVISRDIDLGQTVAASFQTPELFKIAEDLKKMQINAIVSEADIGKIKTGMKVTFTVDAFTGREFTGTINQIRLNSTSQQNVVTYNVLVEVSNEDEALLPGMTALVNIPLIEKKGVLKVPSAALRFKPAETFLGMKVLLSPQRYIYLLEANHAHPVEVTAGISDGRFTEISSDTIRQGDQVILEATETE